MTRPIEVTTTPLAGLLVVRRSPHRDERGSLDRIFDRTGHGVRGIDLVVAQVNHTVTPHQGTVRGMHLQGPQAADVKLINCLRGRVFDVAVDLRAGSDTYLDWFGLVLDAEESISLLVPEGVAHGHQALVDDCELLYIHGGPYETSAELGVRHDDPTIGIDWPLSPIRVSDRDRAHPLVDPDGPGLGW